MRKHWKNKLLVTCVQPMISYMENIGVSKGKPQRLQGGHWQPRVLHKGPPLSHTKSNTRDLVLCAPIPEHWGPIPVCFRSIPKGKLNPNLHQSGTHKIFLATKFSKFSKNSRKFSKTLFFNECFTKNQFSKFSKNFVAPTFSYMSRTKHKFSKKLC